MSARLTCALIALLITTISAWPVTATQFETVAIPRADGRNSPAQLTGYLVRPATAAGQAPAAAVIAMHGCGGVLTRQGNIAAREQDWSAYLAGLGYVVLLVDSFSPRGYHEICTRRERPIRTRDRVDDAEDALVWLAGQPGIDPRRIGLLGWSHGGGAVLEAAATAARAKGSNDALDFRTAVAFYPGCRTALSRADYLPRLPLLILVGEADDWTAARPCAELARKLADLGLPVEGILYPNAHHGFDSPNSPVHQRTGLAITGGGDRATVGTDPAARADARARVTTWLSRHLSN
jgi:dienelactone hydrolase